MVIYDLAIIGTFFLGSLLWQRGAWRNHPAFAGYIAFILLRFAALHPTFRSANNAHYSAVFWWFQIAELVFVGAAVGELFDQKALGAILGGFASVAATLLMLQTKALVAAGDMAAAVTQAKLNLDVMRYSGVFFAVFALFAVRKISGIASGLVVATLFGSIALMAHGPYRYAGSIAWIVALVLWIDWIRTYRVDRGHNAARVGTPTRLSSQPRRGGVFSSSPAPCK